MPDVITVPETTIDLGEWHRGEVPPARPIQLTQADKVTPVQDLTGFTVDLIAVRLVPGETAASYAAAVTITDVPNAVVTIDYTVDLGSGLGLFEQAEGPWAGLVWVGNGSLRYASERLSWRLIEPTGGLVPPV